MNRIITALALSGLFVAAPAFAKVTHQGRKPAVADKAASGDKTAGSAATAKTEGSEPAAKPAKKSKHKKSTKSTEGASTEKPAEAPAK